MLTKICEICGEPFETTQQKKKCCDKQHYKECVICHKKFPVNKRNWKTKQCCSRPCLEEWYKRTGKSEEMHRKAEETKRKRYYDKGIVFNAPKKTRVCVICGKEFQPEAANQKCCKDKHYKPCCICGKPVEVNIHNYDKDVTCGSKKCRYELVKRTSLKRYGVDNAAKSEFFKRKVIQTNLKKYGVEYVTQTTQMKKKSVETSLKRYGTEYPNQSPEVQRKIKSTMKSRYGVESYLETEECQEALRRKCRKKYGVDYPTQSSDVQEKTVRTCLDKYGVPWPCMTEQARTSSKKVISHINVNFSECLKKFGIDFEFEKSVERKSYDLYVKGSNILVEINPTVSHNCVFNVYSGKMIDNPDVYYHLNKTKLAESNGFRCIHVWDWDDWDKVVDLVLPVTRRIYARNCQVVELDKVTTNEFLNSNHLQGTCRSQKVRLGLMYEGELVEVMTFGKPRYNRKFEWELLRLCTPSITSVVGGPSKLFSHFVRTYHPASILTYCDRSKFTGDVYKNIGMTLTDEGTPGKHWYSYKTSEKMQHITNNFLLQRGFDQIFGTSFGKGTSNEYLMLERGYLPVYDCGQLRFEWHS